MPNCPDVYPWFYGGESPYACQPPGNQPGQVDTYIGCEMCCRSFPLERPTFAWGIGAAITGTRFLRPSDILESRDANGRFRWINSNEHLRLPLVSYHQLAMCWSMRGLAWRPHEYWDKTICDCPFFCGPGMTIPWDVQIMTCGWFTGYQLPPNMYCTGITLGDQPETVAFAGGSLHQGAFVTTGRIYHGGAHDWWGGTSNVLNLCKGRIESCSPTCDPRYPFPLQQQSHFAANDAIWNYLLIRDCDARLVSDDASPDEQHAVIVGAKNASLEWLTRDITVSDPSENSVTHLDRLAGTDDNNQLDWWAGGWNDPLDEDHIPLSEMPIVKTWPDCYLRFSRHPVIVEWVIAYAAIEASIVLYRVKQRRLGENWPANPVLHSRMFRPYRPLIRLRVRIEMALRARFADDGVHQLVRDWLLEDAAGRIVDLEIENREAERYPQILPLRADGRPSDEVLYVDEDGRHFDGLPPLDIEWHGYHGPSMDGDWIDVFPHEYFVALGIDTVEAECCAVAKGMQSIRVDALPSHPDAESGSRHRLYAGSVTIGIDYGAYGWCPP